MNLANVMEFATPKKLMNEVAEPALVKFLKKFYPEIFADDQKKDDGVPDSLS